MPSHLRATKSKQQLKHASVREATVQGAEAALRDEVQAAVAKALNMGLSAATVQQVLHGVAGMQSDMSVDDMKYDLAALAQRVAQLEHASSTPNLAPSSDLAPPPRGISRVAAPGRHWAEGSGFGNRPDAQTPWQSQGPSSDQLPPSAAAIVVEQPPPALLCQPSAVQSAELSPPSTLAVIEQKDGFEFSCTFPMVVLKMDTFLSLESMLTYEALSARGDLVEWAPGLGSVFFVSHQWCSFSHPDPSGIQLRAAQQLLTRCREGQLRSIFATEEEWLAYHLKDQTGTLSFAKVTPEEFADDVANGYVWLDYSSVPQAAEAEEARLKAIDSIPFYVDNSQTFLALVPRIEHADLPGTFCDYKSWTQRGWCRLECMVQELRLFHPRPGEMVPGVGNIDIPRRPLVVHSGSYATTYDMCARAPARLSVPPLGPVLFTRAVAVHTAPRVWFFRRSPTALPALACWHAPPYPAGLTTFTCCGSARTLCSTESLRAVGSTTPASCRAATRSVCRATRSASGRWPRGCGTVRLRTCARAIRSSNSSSIGDGKRTCTS